MNQKKLCHPYNHLLKKQAIEQQQQTTIDTYVFTL